MPYTIFTREQVSPKYITVHGATHDETTLNLGSKPVYPPGATLCFRPEQDLYSVNAFDRLELLADPNGTATVADVKAALPQFIAYRLSLIAAEAERRIEAIWPLTVRTNCSLGLYDATVSQQIRDDISTIMAKAYAAEDAINAATTIDGLLAVVMEA